MAHEHPFTRDEALSMWTRLVAGWADHLDGSGARLLIDGVSNVHDAGGSYEGVTRMLWGLGGWLSVDSRPTTVQWRGVDYDLLALTRRALLAGTDPESPGYWGIPASPGASDQRTVETGQVAFAVWQTRTRIWHTLSPLERDQITNWLAANGSRPPIWRNNWALFWALNHHVRAALEVDHDPDLVTDVLDYLDTVYCGDGWYDDGPNLGTDHFDDYNLWVFGAHVLAWAQIEPNSSERKAALLERVRLQMQHLPYFFAADGAYAEFGRSLSYKFARLGAPIWSYHAGVWPHPVGMLKRLVGRHLRWYLDHGAARADGSLRQSLTHDGSLGVRETYISTGATYWAMQAFGALWTLPDDDPFWTAPEEPLPVETDDFVRVMPEPGFVLVGTAATGAVQRFTSRAHHMSAKYSKYLYSTAAPFNVGLADGLPLPDAMLCLTDGERRGHKDAVLASAAGERGWLRFRYPQVIGKFTHILETIIVPIGEDHLRIHRVELDAACTDAIHGIEGAAPLGFPKGAVPQTGAWDGVSWAAAGSVMVAIAGIAGYDRAGMPSSFGAPDANSVFGQQLTPNLVTSVLETGAVLANIVHVGSVLDDPLALRQAITRVDWYPAGDCVIDLADGSTLQVPPLQR